MPVTGQETVAYVFTEQQERQSINDSDQKRPRPKMPEKVVDRRCTRADLAPFSNELQRLLAIGNRESSIPQLEF